jgi:hypothetical protein
LKSAFSQFTSGERTIKDLVIDIVRHDEFVLRRAPKP